MNPGEFRHKTRLSVKTTTQRGDYGDIEISSTTTHDIYAKIKWLPGSEQVNAEVVQLIKNAEFIYRFSSVTEIIDRIDTIDYLGDSFFVKSIQYTGHANQQMVIIKAQTAQ